MAQFDWEKDAVVVQPAPAVVPNAGEDATPDAPSFMRQFTAAMAPSAETELATAQRVKPGAWRAPDAPLSLSGPQPTEEEKAVAGQILYKGADGKPRRFYQSTMAPLLGGAARALPQALGGAAGTAIGLTPPALAASFGTSPLAMGALGAVAGDSAADAVYGLLGGADARTSGEKIRAKASLGLLDASVGAGLGAAGAVVKPLARGIKEGLVTGANVVKAEAKGLLERVKGAGLQPTRETILEPTLSTTEQNVAKKTAELRGQLAQELPADKLGDKELGEAIQHQVRSRAGTQTKGAYFEQMDRAYQGQMDAALQPLGSTVVPTPEYVKFLARKQRVAVGQEAALKEAVPADARKRLEQAIAMGGMRPAQIQARLQVINQALDRRATPGVTLQGNPALLAEEKAALSADLETALSAKGQQHLDAYKQAKAIYTERSRVKEAVDKIAEAGSGREALKLTAADLTPEGLHTFLTTMEDPRALPALRRRIIDNLATVRDSVTGRPQWDLQTLMKEVNKLDPEAKTLLLPQGNSRFAQLLLEAEDIAAKGGLFGGTKLPEVNPNAITRAFLSAGTNIGVKLSNAFADKESALRFFIWSSKIPPQAVSSVIGAIARIPNASIREQLVADAMADAAAARVDTMKRKD